MAISRFLGLFGALFKPPPPFWAPKCHFSPTKNHIGMRNIISRYFLRRIQIFGQNLKIFNFWPTPPPRLPKAGLGDLAVFGHLGVQKSVFSKLLKNGGDLKETPGDLF
jgi:hypothetical protein